MLYEVPLDRIDEMADASADAFVGANDPMGNFMFQNEPDHLVLKRRFFRSLVTSCSPKAIRQGISPNLEAISLWFPRAWTIQRAWIRTLLAHKISRTPELWKKYRP